MSYFTEDFNQFFIELAPNNHKEWFDENRKRYEKSVKKPFDAFINALIENIRNYNPEVSITAKEAVFRINRDIRFSKDKSLYKLNRSAIISPAGRKDHSVPGFYIQLGPEAVHMGGGAYFLQSDQLAKVRDFIATYPKKFRKVVEDKDFKKVYGTIKGDENKRLDKSLKEAAEKEPLLFKKQFYYMTEIAAESLTDKNFMDTVMTYYLAGKPVEDFLNEALA